MLYLFEVSRQSKVALVLIKPTIDCNVIATCGICWSTIKHSLQHRRYYFIIRKFASCSRRVWTRKFYYVEPFAQQNVSISKKGSSRRIEAANKQLHCYHVKLCCMFGGKKFHKTGEGERSTKWWYMRYTKYYVLKGEASVLVGYERAVFCGI